MGEWTKLPSPREAMQVAIECAQRGEAEMAIAWTGIARELREGTPADDVPVPQSGGVASQADWERAIARAGRHNPGQLLDEGQRHEDAPDATAVQAFGPDGLQRVADALRETEEERTKHFAAGTVRPYVRTSDETERFDAFGLGRASVSEPRSDVEDTRLLTAGDMTRCRNCDFDIQVEIEPSDTGLAAYAQRKRYVHTLTGQVICPSPPRHTNEQGDETYVTGPHTMAAPGGVAYRAS